MSGAIDSILATVEGMEKRGGDMIVTVRVKGVSDTLGDIPNQITIPSMAANLRARARALVAAGALPSGVETVRDLTTGDIERLTDVESETEEGSGIIVDKVYKVKVNS